jgi:uncharacterized membrane protein (DUF373 family)
MFFKFLNSKKRLYKVLRQILFFLLLVGLILLSISLYIKFDEQKLENEIREALQKGLYTFDKQ